MSRDLELLVENYTKGFLGAVIWDCYKAHITPKVRAKARCLKKLP